MTEEKRVILDDSELDIPIYEHLRKEIDNDNRSTDCQQNKPE